MAMRTNISAICGGEKRAKLLFMERLNQVQTTPESYRQAMEAFTMGFIACNNMIMDAIRDGVIEVTLFDTDGTPLHFISIPE